MLSHLNKLNSLRFLRFSPNSLIVAFICREQIPPAIPTSFILLHAIIFTENYGYFIFNRSRFTYTLLIFETLFLISTTSSLHHPHCTILLLFLSVWGTFRFWFFFFLILLYFQQFFQFLNFKTWLSFPLLYPLHVYYLFSFLKSCRYNFN